MSKASNGGPKTKRHHATAKSWEWLEKGDGRRLDAVQKSQIRIQLNTLDKMLLAWDHECGQSAE